MSGKNNRNGKAALMSELDYSKIRKNIKAQKFRLLLDLAWYTGERWGALVQLKLDDVYESFNRGSGRKTRDTITFRASTRKARPDGSRESRQIPIHPVLKEALEGYLLIVEKSDSQWLFPRESDGNFHITLRVADKVLREATEKSGLSSRGISTHSTRRSFISKLHNKGVDIYTIKQITGHKSLSVLQGYIEQSADVVRGAIFAL